MSRSLHLCFCTKYFANWNMMTSYTEKKYERRVFMIEYIVKQIS